MAEVACKEARKEARGSVDDYTMATGTGPGLTVPADQSPHELGEDDLRVVFRALHSVAEKYKVLGVEMNVKMTEIKKIQRQCFDHDECLLEVLLVRLKQIPSLTWRDIETALRSDTVGEPQLADRIRRQYGHLYSLHLSLESPLGKKQRTKVMTRSKKKEVSARISIQEHDFVEEVSEPERYRKPSEEGQMESMVVKKTWQKAKKSTFTKIHSARDNNIHMFSETECGQRADQKRRLKHKHQRTPRLVKLKEYYAASGKESSSIHSETQINLDKSPETIVEKLNSDMSDMEEQQHVIRKTGRKMRVHSDSQPASSPVSQGGTQSDSKCRRRETKHQTHIKRVRHQKSSSSSETDDDSSSQECDLLKNLSESENKALIKAFKCCFGKLCLAIKDPEKAAAELQARHLLSCSMIESLLTSPESQQVKAIALVRALKKRIKSRPVRVFTIIEVFLHNENLKEAGRELWSETGIRLPNFPDMV